MEEHLTDQELDDTLAEFAAETLLDAAAAQLIEPLATVPGLWRVAGKKQRLLVAGEIDRSVDALQAAGGALPAVRAEHAAAWTERFRDLLAQDPGIADRLYSTMEDIERLLPEPAPDGPAPDGPDGPAPDGMGSEPSDVAAAVPGPAVVAGSIAGRPPARRPAWILRFARLHPMVTALIAALAIGAVLSGIVITAIKLRPGPDEASPATFTLRAVIANGDRFSARSLDEARRILTDRLRAAGAGKVTVTIDNRRGELAIRVAHAPADDQLRLLLGTGRMTMRRVLSIMELPADKPAPLASSVASGHSAAARSDAASTAWLRAKLGEAYDVAEERAILLEQSRRHAGTATDTSAQDEAMLRVLAPFAELSPSEIALLPAELQYYTPTVTCPQLNARAIVAPTDPAGTITACRLWRGARYVKYLLDPAKVGNVDVRRVTVRNEPTPPAHIIEPAARPREIFIEFNAEGRLHFADLTESAAAGGGEPRIAIVVDDVVMLDPSVDEKIVGTGAVISGVAEAEATALVALLRYGPLPMTFEIARFARL